MNLSMKRKQTQNRLVVVKELGVERAVEWEVKVSKCKLLHIE